VSVTVLDPAAAARLRAAPFTYAEVGATRGDLPSGHTHLRRARVVTGSLTTLADRLRSWQVHAGAGLSVAASGPVDLGAVVWLRLGVGALSLTAPCRVVYTIDEADRTGFAYGTLPGHPESGEEAFVLERVTDGRVRFTVTAFSTPATLLARAAGPVGRVGQRVIASRYLDAIIP
jgi:uncharacterized protein (UPF0548 family)